MREFFRILVISSLALILATGVQFAIEIGLVWIAILGMPGIWASMLIEGPHGGSPTNYLSMGVSILINGFIYWLVIWAVSTKLFSRSPRT
jgi:hypothetical protein